MRKLLSFTNSRGSELVVNLEPWGEAFCLSHGEEIVIESLPDASQDSLEYDAYVEEASLTLYVTGDFSGVRLVKDGEELIRD